MSLMNRTKDFFSKGGIIFSSKHNFLAKSVQALGLAAIVTVFPSDTSKAGAIFFPVTVHSVKEVNDNILLRNVASKFSDGTVSAAREAWRHLTSSRSPGSKEGDITTDEKQTTIFADLSAYISYHMENAAANLTIHEFGGYKVPHYIAKEILRAAKDTDFPPDTLFAIAEKESSFDPHARPKTSSAYGLMQFIEQSWLGVVKEYGEGYGLEYEAGLINKRKTKHGTEYYVDDPEAEKRILELRTSPYLSSVFTAVSLLDAKKTIEARVKSELSNEELYIPHFLGTNGAGKLLEKAAAKPNTSASRVFPKAARANKNMFRGKGGKPLTVRQFKEMIVATIEKRTEKYNDIEEIIADATPALKDNTEDVVLSYAR